MDNYLSIEENIRFHNLRKNMATSANTHRKVSKEYTDLYSTPEEALKELSKRVMFDKSKVYFEPCDGLSKVSNFFKDNLDIHMITNELNDHASEDTDYNEDFLKPNTLALESWKFDYIVTNPPFKYAMEFVNEGFKYAKEQYHLVRINFLEGGKRYNELFAKKHLKNVYLFSYRISCPKGVDEEKSPNAVAYCWVHFDRDFIGQPTLHWINK